MYSHFPNWEWVYPWWFRRVSSTAKQRQSSFKILRQKLKRSIQINRKVLQQKSLELSQLKYSGKLFISESMCYENQQVVYKFRQLKNFKKIHSTWFWKNVVNIKVYPNGEIHQIFHTTDIKKLLGIENFEDFINNTSS